MRYALMCVVLLSFPLWIVGVVNAHQPTPTLPAGKIIYVVHDTERSIQNLWLLDLSNPHAPRPLTHFDTPSTWLGYNLAQDGRTLAYRAVGSIEQNAVMDIETGSIRLIPGCGRNSCLSGATLSPDGRYAVYEGFPDELRIVDLYSIPSIDRVLHTFDMDALSWYAQNLGQRFRPSPAWIGNSTYLAFSLPFSPWDVQVIDIEDPTYLAILPLGVFHAGAIFSPDGSRYAHFGLDYTNFVTTREVLAPSNFHQYQRDDLIKGEEYTTSIIGWHPDSRHLLISNRFFFRENRPPDYQSHDEFALFDSLTGNIDVLLKTSEVEIRGGSWNEDGTYFVYTESVMQDDQTYDERLMLFDMETRQSIPLGVTGRYAKWFMETAS